MLIQLKLTWRYDHSYVDPNDSRISGDFYYADEWNFDTATRLVVYTPSTDPNAQQYDFYTGAQGNNNPPVDFSRPTTVEFFHYVSGATRTGYFHDGAGGVTLQVQTLTLASTVVSCTCYGDNTAAIDLQVSGLPGPYTYLWDDGPTVEDRGLLRAGTYRVAVTDVPSGAIARATIQVGSNPELDVLIQKVGGAVSLVVTGGVGLYTYLWSDGSTARDRTGLTTGTHSCTITDVLGCRKTITVEVRTDLFFWSRNPITLALDAGAAYRADPTTKPHLTFLCEVWVEPDYLSNVFEQVGGVLEQPADREGRTTFEVQALLDVFLQHHVPPVAATRTLRADPMFRRFYLKYAESFGATPVRAGTTVLTQNYVVLGGLSFYESRTRTFFDSYQNDVKPFLTWEPPVKPALADQPEYLYYLVKESLAGFRFQVRVQYEDGTSETVNVGGVNNVNLHEVYCRPVGYAALGLAALAGTKRVRWWEVYVTSPDELTVLSETRRYVLDRRVFPHRRYFLFATSLGGMATYVATGDVQVDAEVTGAESARTLTPDSDPLDGDTDVQTRSLRAVVKVASGVRTRAQLQASQDLLLSRRVLLLRDGRWLPGYVKAKTSPLLDETKPVPTQEFEFYLPAEELYTPALGRNQVTYSQPLL
ncbi:SprB repeat-containing protein [Hymenobacter convexus]|uniref:SprB repeat-containing protein n=1 Tax=Hymenobacter sp. CA1UV-4 TaxID=3063782 RepID=UPI0027132797|nr:SprB repeat-containing protein [Hymenobacter sp. CA1UV-4]MDO7853145.1 SprB repeat-containing protein [Hymenobacter sp. CA1UV-4]